MKTLFVGQNIIHLKSVDSTNSYATELLRQIIVSDGTVIYTFEQEKGRGQRGNSWESEPNKNVAFSLILYPAFLSAEKQFLLTKMCSLALSDLMAELIGFTDKPKQIHIKWPNDIYVNDKKIAGILIENNLRDHIIQSTVIGVGLNVNQLKFNSTKNATSLKQLADSAFDLLQVVEHLCKFMEARYLQLKGGKLETIDSAYLDRLYRLNIWAEYTANEQLFEGKIIGVSAAGKLRIELRSGEIKSFDLKEITFN